jgi:NAD(P)H-quinone oxidoreductase subunit 5
MFTDQLLASLWLGIVCLPLICAICTGLSQRWTIARMLIGAGLGVGVPLWLLTLLSNRHGDETALFVITPVKATLLLLIYFIAFIVMRYARANFAGDPDNKRFLRWLMLTVFSVIVTVATNHLLVFWLSWVGISLNLHQLLMFYPNRPRAAMTAIIHKNEHIADLINNQWLFLFQLDVASNSIWQFQNNHWRQTVAEEG